MQLYDCEGIELMGSAIDKPELRTKLSICRPAVRAAIAAYIQKVAVEHASEVVCITLYGSQARGESSEESDIDLFVVVRHDTPALRQSLADLAWQVQFEHDIVISDMIRSVTQLNGMRGKQGPYYQSIEREGIVLWKSACPSPSRSCP